MTVYELIRELTKFDPDKEVWMQIYPKQKPVTGVELNSDDGDVELF